MALPSRGSCGLCAPDAGHTPCERPGCGVWYISHDEILPTPVQAPPPNVGPLPLPAITQLRVPPSDAMVPSRAPTANALPARQARGSQSNVWGNSLSTVGAATLGGDRGRRHHAIHSCKFGPDTGAAAARGPQRPYTLPGSGSQALALGRLAAASAPTPVTVTFTFALWPLPIPTPWLNGAEYLEYYPSDVRLLGEAHFVSTLKKFCLIMKFVAPTADTQHSFYAELNTKIFKHMAANNLRFSGSIPNPILLPSDVASAEWHNTNFLNFLWTTFAPGNTPPPGTNRKLGLGGVPWQVSPSHIVPISHPAHIGPKYGPIEGHPPGFHDFHECFALWVMAALDLDNDPVICLPPCPSTSSAAVDQAGSSLSATSSRLPPLPTVQQSRSIEPSIVGSVASPAWMNSAAIDSDNEDAQIQQAIIASRGLTRSQSGTSCPLPQMPMVRARPLSDTPSPPARPASRRRLNPNPPVQIDLTRDQSMSPLLRAIASFSTLLGKSGYWNSGDSVGVGVCRTILSGLVTLVFSDRAIWKQLGDANMLELAPAGIPPDPNRMKLIKAHGYMVSRPSFAPHSLIRELAQKPHKPHAAFWHCAKPRAEIRPKVTEKLRREKCAKSEWSQSDGWTNRFPSSRINQIVIWMNAIRCKRDLRVL
ncbi:hypothetical protein K438DRAFT_1787868 [Mycena galopus ATCC 62051]|nr:hypothetical protein K438DRAFT_1787868 [Mycena galopus ATCC 62051]